MSDLGAGDRDNTHGGFRIRFITLDFTLEAFEIDAPNCALDHDGTSMDLGERLLDGCKVGAYAGQKLIVIPNSDAMDPFKEVCLYETDAKGKPLVCKQSLGGYDDIVAYLAAMDDHAGRRNELTLMPGQEYLFLWGAPERVQYYWEDLRDLVNSNPQRANPKLTADAREGQMTTDMRKELFGYIKWMPFFKVVATPLPETDAADPGTFPGFEWLTYDMKDGGLQPTCRALLTLLVMQAGVDPQLKPLVLDGHEEMWTRGRFTPFEQLAIDTEFDWYVLVQRPTVATVYLAELYDRELRRRRRNLAWPSAAFGIYRGMAEAAEQKLPITSIHDELVKALDVYMSHQPTTAADMAEAQRQWLHDLAREHKDLGDADQIRLLSKAVGAMAATPNVPTQDATGFKVAEGPFSLYVKASGLEDQREAEQALNQRAAQFIPGRLLIFAMLSSFHFPESSFEQIREISVRYFEQYLFGFRFYRSVPSYPGNLLWAPGPPIDLRQAFKDDEDGTANLLIEFKGAIATMLEQYAPQDRLEVESDLRGDSDQLFGHDAITIRKRELHRRVGGDWFASSSPDWLSGYAAAAKPYVLRFITPARALNTKLQEYYQTATQEIIWDLVSKSQGLEKPEEALRARVLRHTGGVAGYMQWAAGTDESVMFAFGATMELAMEVPVQGEVRAWNTRVTGGRVGSSATLAEFVAYEVEQRGTLDEQTLRRVVSEDDAEDLVKSVASKINADDLKVPACLEVFMSAAGVALSLVALKAEWNKATGLGRISLLAKLSGGVLSGFANIVDAYRLVRQASFTAEALGTPTLQFTGTQIQYLRYLDDVEGVASSARSLAGYAGGAASLIDAADIYLSPESARNLAQVTDDDATFAWAGLKGAFLTIAGSAAIAEAAGLAAVTITGPIGLICGVSIILIDAHLASLQTEYTKQVDNVNLVWSNGYAKVTDGVYVSLYAQDLKDLNRVVTSQGRTRILP